MKRWKGLGELVVDAVDFTTRLAQETHESVAGTVYRNLRRLPPLEGPAGVVESVHLPLTRAVHGSVRLTNAAVGAALDVGHRLAGTDASDPELNERPTPQRSDAMGSVTWVRDSALAALNGAVGDYLEERRNGLGIGLSLRHDGRRLEPTREALAEAFPEATGKVCVLVHGLMTTEWSWSMFAEEAHGDPGATYGSLLARDLGYTPVYVRYNSGRRIPHNGRELAQVLERFVEAYPAPVEELLLIGHSMGGLVSRSACHYGAEEGHDWVARTRRVFCLGSPHLGAPLEKASHVVSRALGLIDHPGAQIPRTLLEGRSAGIKDLRHGSIVDDHLPDHDPRAFTDARAREVPFVPHVGYYFVAGTITVDPEHPVGHLVGDLLVHRPSAAGDHESHDYRVPLGDGHHLGGVSHVRLVNHPELYARLRQWCEAPPPSALG